MEKNPIREMDENARLLVRDMLTAMRHAILAVTDAGTGFPHLSRIACQLGPEGLPIALLAGIALHSRALAEDGRAGLLVDPAHSKGDPMTWPRLSLQVEAEPIAATATLRDRWLDMHPRAAIFIDLPDFRFWQMRPKLGLLNAGFGAAYRLTPEDLQIT